jgi:hypothetical protein
VSVVRSRGKPTFENQLRLHFQETHNTSPSTQHDNRQSPSQEGSFDVKYDLNDL